MQNTSCEQSNDKTAGKPASGHGVPSSIEDPASSINHPSGGPPDPQPPVLQSAGDEGGPTLNSQPVFPRFPGETPRAFSAFTTFFELGHSRSLPAVADLLGENHDTVRRWSSKFRWSNRIHSANSNLLQHQADAQAAA